MEQTFFKLVSAEGGMTKAIGRTENIGYYQKLIEKYKPWHFDNEKGICANCLAEKCLETGTRFVVEPDEDCFFSYNSGFGLYHMSKDGCYLVSLDKRQGIIGFKSLIKLTCK